MKCITSRRYRHANKTAELSTKKTSILYCKKTPQIHGANDGAT